MKYGNISEVMVFKTDEIFSKAVKVLVENAVGFENSGFPLALNFYPDRHYSFPYAQAHLGLAGIKDGEHYEVKYR